MRLLVVALALQVLLAALLIWGAATGFSVLRGLFSAPSVHRPTPSHAPPVRRRAAALATRSPTRILAPGGSGSPATGLYNQ